MEFFKIGTADIIIDDQGNGRGKIIIADQVNGRNFSYYWGAMGTTMKDFLLSIDDEYFSKNLAGPHDSRRINMRATLANVRRKIREEFPWYEHMEFQSELREKIRTLSDCQSPEHFVDRVSRLPGQLMYFGCSSWEEDELSERLTAALDEPWYLVETGDSHAVIYLKLLHKQLKEELKKPQPVAA